MHLTKQYFLRVLFAIAAFCGISAFDANAAASCSSKHAKEICIVQNASSRDFVLERGMMLATNAAISPRGSQRIGGSRPSRLIPTNNGKPSRVLGKWLAGNPLSHYRTTNQFFRYVLPSPKGGAASPRFYYVIALRRILC